jgi:hypothetical protein
MTFLKKIGNFKSIGHVNMQQKVPGNYYYWQFITTFSPASLGADTHTRACSETRREIDKILALFYFFSKE